MAYTTEAKIEAYLMIEIDSSFSSNITAWISAVTKYIENYTGRVFEAVNETKYYDGNEQKELMIDDIISITSIQILDNDGNVDKTLVSGLGNDYLTYPANFTTKNSIRLLDTAVYATFPKGNQNIKIVGSFGHSSSVPADIELVATQLVVAIVQKGLRGGEISSESLGDYSVSFVEESAEKLGVNDILDNYKIFEV